MRTAAFLTVVLLVAIANAQPGMQQPPPPPHQILVTGEDAELLEIGEISDAQHVGGGIASLSLGLGIGQAIQGRWASDGWKFTLGETASGAAVVYGLVQVLKDCPPGETRCHSDGAWPLVGGVLAFGVFRVWGTFDAFTAPPRHNARLHELRMRLGLPEPQTVYGMTPYVVPTAHGDGAVAGLGLRF